MKVISDGQFSDVIEDILISKEKQAKMLGQLFVGVTEDEVLSELKKRLGDDWMVRKSPPFKLSPHYDIPAIARSRYFKGIGLDGQIRKGSSGLALLMMWGIITFVLVVLTLVFGLIPMPIYYALGLIASSVLVWRYSKGESTTKDELMRVIYGRDSVEADRG